MKHKLIKAPITHLTEIFQSLDIKFAFLNKKGDSYKQTHVELKCRDFLGDCIWSKKTKKASYIYSFRFDHKKTPLDEDKTTLSLFFPPGKSIDFFKANFEKLNEIEAVADVSPASWKETDQPNTLILEADKEWQSSVWKISLYTFYLKMISYKDRGSMEQPENTYITLLTPEIEAKLLSKVKEPQETLAEDIFIAHNYSGFISIIKNQNKEMNALLLGGT